MNKRQHKKWLKKLMQMAVAPTEKVDGDKRFTPVYETKYLVSNDTRLLFWDFMKLAKKHTIVEVQWCKKENKPNIVQNIPYVCLVVYVEHYDIDI